MSPSMLPLAQSVRGVLECVPLEMLALGHVCTEVGLPSVSVSCDSLSLPLCLSNTGRGVGGACSRMPCDLGSLVDLTRAAGFFS